MDKESPTPALSAWQIYEYIHDDDDDAHSTQITNQMKAYNIECHLLSLPLSSIHLVVFNDSNLIHSMFEQSTPTISKS